MLLRRGDQPFLLESPWSIEGRMSETQYGDKQAAEALVAVIGDSRWEAVAVARGYLALLDGADIEQAARAIYEAGKGTLTLKRSRERIEQSPTKGFLNQLTSRTKIGSAENPITKLFPARITEQRFLELIEELCNQRPSLSYFDDRDTGHTLTDFTFLEGGYDLPINIKNAGTRFERAEELVGLKPDDCVPIPAYKAHNALDAKSSLLYVISVDYHLVNQLNGLLPKVLSHGESVVWDLLNRFGGSHLRDAEDRFISSVVHRHWPQIKQVAQDNPFYAISARKAIRILQTKPKRTPGIGLRAWGTGASAEVNVHISLTEDATPWPEVAMRIVESGITDILTAVNRKHLEEVYDPEI